MTLCAAINLNNQGLLLVADTVITERRNIPDLHGPSIQHLIVSPSGEVIDRYVDTEGSTTRGERFQPTTQDSTITYSLEGACKIAFAGPDTFLAFAGDAEFSTRISEEITIASGKAPPGSVIPRENMAKFLSVCAASAAQNFQLPVNTKAEALLCAKSTMNIPLLLQIKFQVVDTGVDYSFREVPSNELCMIGRGADLLSDLGTSPSDYFAFHPLPIALCHMAGWFSQKTRERQGNKVHGIGGAFFGVSVTLVPGQSGYMIDMLEVFFTERGEIRVLNKTICREHIFFVLDYVRKQAGIYPILNLSKRYSEQELIKLSLPVLQTEFSSLDARCIIVEHETAESPSPKVHSIYDATGFNVLKGVKLWESNVARGKLGVEFEGGSYLIEHR